MAIVAKILSILLTGILVITSAYLLLSNNAGNGQSVPPPTRQSTPTKVPLPSPPESHVIAMKKHVVQSFNNCGPASLSMLLSYFDIEKSQQELGQQLRPWQNPQGINDDKNVFLSELARTAPEYNLQMYHRRDGDMEILKQLIANDIPVLVRTYLHPGEDIGHFRILRGYNDSASQLIQDDSFEGKNLTYSYDVFMDMWKPYNFEYVVFFQLGQKQLVDRIIGDEINEMVAWNNAKIRSENDLRSNPDDIHALFNLSIALFHLQEYQASVESFEKAEQRLSARTLWYQIEPIQAYLTLKNYDRVFSLTDRILRNNNLAFSELYLIRAESYRQLGNLQLAGEELQKARLYNQNLQVAIIAETNLASNQPLFTSL